MPEPAVVNASPLILLARAGCLDLLRVASDIVLVPAAVETELRRRGSYDETVEAISQATWIQFVADLPTPSSIQVWDLGPAESSVLAWAAAHPTTEAVIDDLAARRCAAAIGVPVRGTLGIVLLAKQRSIIASARPIVDRLLQSGMYLSKEVIASALALVGE